MGKTGGGWPRRIEPDEKDLQTLVESQLDRVEPGLRLVDRYVPVGRGVIDSMCIDGSGAPIVIEYKVVEGEDEQALIQAMSYAAWVDQNPDTIARFIRQRLADALKEDTPGDARIVIIAPSFTDRTLLAATMVDADLTLKRYLCFEHENVGTWVHLEDEYSSSQVQYGGNVPRTYSFDYHFEGGYARMRPLFELLRAKIEALGDVTTYPKKHYIAFRRRGIFAVAHVFVSKIELGIRVAPGADSPRLETADDWSWSWITHHLTLAKEADVDDEALSLVRASYDAMG